MDMGQSQLKVREVQLWDWTFKFLTEILAPLSHYYVSFRNY